MDLIKKYEPPELHDSETKKKELIKAGIPLEIINYLTNERKRIELPKAENVSYIEFCAILDVTEMEFEGIKLFDLIFDMDNFDAGGTLVWIPSKKTLGSFDISHEKLMIVHDATWDQFLKKPDYFIDRILDGEYDDEYDIE